MSDALNYLIKARPEAMKAYFAFFKESGKHLDPKTRSLISVITKIDSQTERGLRQYLPRALRDGATPDEILDAILTALPTLGLAKIVWATDIILDMDMPEFRTELLGAETSWHDLIDWAMCDGCSVECLNAGTRSEGWYTDCDPPIDGLIAWADCDPTM